MEIFFEGSVLDSGLEALAQMLTEKFQKDEGGKEWTSEKI